MNRGHSQLVLTTKRRSARVKEVMRVALAHGTSSRLQLPASSLLMALFGIVLGRDPNPRQDRCEWIYAYAT